MMIHKKRSGIDERTIEHANIYVHINFSSPAFLVLLFSPSSTVFVRTTWQGSRLIDVLHCLDGLRLMMHSYLLKCLHRLFLFHFLLLLLLLLDLASTVIKSS